MAHRVLRPLSWGAALFLFLIPFAFVGHALLASRVYAPIDKTYLGVPLSVLRDAHGIAAVTHNPATTDIVSQMIPWRQAVRDSVLRGDWPLWNPFILCGDILAAAAQPAPYSPFTLLALLLPAAISFTFTAAITFFVAALGTFLFARELGLRESAAAIGAVGFTYSTSIALYVLWPLGFTWALLPFVLFAVRRGSFAILTTALTLLILAGHPESVLHVVTIGVVYGLLFARDRWRVALAAGATALLLTAIFLLPYLEAMPQSAEYAFRKTWTHVRADPTEKVLMSLATDVFPFLHLQRWNMKAETPAAGSIVLGLAIYAIWRVRSRQVWFFTGLALFGIAAHAAWKPVAALLQSIPLFDLAIHERLAFAAAFALAMLAAIAVDAIVVRPAAITLAIVLVILTAGTFWIKSAIPLDPAPGMWGKYRIAAELGGLFLATILIAMRVPIPVLVALLLAQRVVSEGGVHKSFPRETAYPDMRLFEPLRSAPKPFRIAGQGFALMPGTSALYGWEDVRGYEAMTFAPLQATYRLWCVPQPVFFNRIDDLSKPFLSMMNVRFAFASEHDPVPPGWRVAAREQSAVLLENLDVIERAFVPRTVALGRSDDEAIDEMANARDFRERAWIAADHKADIENGPGEVRMRSRTRIDANMQRDGWVVVSNSAWKGWRAYVDGRRVKIARANVAFLGIPVPAGRHEIRVVYRPGSFVIGGWISLATAVGLLGCWVARLLGRFVTPSNTATQ